MNNLPNCPKCNSEYVYEDGSLLVCPECAYEWNPAEQAEVEEGLDKLGLHQRFAAGAGDPTRFDEVFVLANFAQQFFGGEFVFGFCTDVPRVGIVAELATHGTALQEGDEADAGAVDGAHRFERVDASDDRGIG